MKKNVRFPDTNRRPKKLSTPPVHACADSRDVVVATSSSAPAAADPDDDDALRLILGLRNALLDLHVEIQRLHVCDFNINMRSSFNFLFELAGVQFSI